MNNDDLTLQISPDNVAIVKDEEKCIKCGYCVRVCRNDVTVSRMYELLKSLFVSTVDSVLIIALRKLFLKS